MAGGLRALQGRAPQGPGQRVRAAVDAAPRVPAPLPARILLPRCFFLTDPEASGEMADSWAFEPERSYRVMLAGHGDQLQGRPGLAGAAGPSQRGIVRH